MRWLRRLSIASAALIVAAIGMTLGVMGWQLAALGGSAYYLLAGASLLIAAGLIAAGRRTGYWLIVLVTLATGAWAFWETGGERWGMLARVFAPLVLSVAIMPVATVLRPARFESRQVTVARLWGLFATSCAGIMVLLLTLQDRSPDNADSTGSLVEVGAPTEWPAYGGTLHADRFSEASQVNPDNAARLERAWTFRTGGLDDLGNNSRFTATPLVIRDRLVFCDPRNRIFALNPSDGREIWRYDPQVDASKAFSIVCRGVAWASVGSGNCAERILEATLDARMIAVDARDGKPCAGFGTDGAISLLDGVAERFDGYYYGTSPPTVVRDAAVVGGYVIDNQRLDPARSVVRAFDVRTGALRWAWDPGASQRRDGGSLYSAGNPNAWAPFSADEEAGLVYIPTGNSSPDFFGGLRTEAAEKYGTAIVALDIASGTIRWSFQTVHHDLWDYDMPAQPSLVDIMVGGIPRKALVATGKTGQIFVLDRLTGAPIFPIEERAVPQTRVQGERTAATQPYSPALPSFAPAPIAERMMWGATPLDQLWCRLQFRRLRYEGDYTPPSTDRFLFSPGTFGAINWGGIAVDRHSGLALVNASNMPFIGQLVPRAEADAAGAAPFVPGDRSKPPPEGRVPMMAMAGTPYALTLAPFLSPIGFPCLGPPWGEIAAVDLTTGKTRWRQPFGSTRGLAPFGLDLPLGTFNLGGAVVTGGGVAFVAATTDGWLRAIDMRTGRVLWRDALPAGGQATPISYIAADGRQMIAVVSGGHGSLRTPRGDWIVAYALPRSMIRRPAP